MSVVKKKKKKRKTCPLGLKPNNQDWGHVCFFFNFFFCKPQTYNNNL